MPEIKDYQGKKKTQGEKRRPHRSEQAMAEAEEVKAEAAEIVVEATEIQAEAEEIRAEAEMVSEGAPAFNEEVSSQDTSLGEDRAHLEFYGSEMIRQKAPKVMELADTVVDQWKKDGQFQGLPVGNPLAQVAAAKALRTAKDVEKKLEEKGVFAMAKMGIDLVKSKIDKKNH